MKFPDVKSGNQKIVVCECKLLQTLWKIVWQFLKLTIVLPYKKLIVWDDFHVVQKLQEKKKTNKSKHINLALSHIYEERLNLSS